MAQLIQENTVACWGHFQGQEDVAGASEVALVAKCWSHKRENPGSDPQHPCKMLSMPAISVLRRWRQQGPLVTEGAPNSVREPNSKDMTENKTSYINICLQHAPTYMYTHTHTPFPAHPNMLF